MSDIARKKMSEDRKGIGNPMYGKTLSNEHRKKISNSNKGKARTEKQIQRIRELNKGKHLSEETKYKISETKKKNKFVCTKETRGKISKANTGKKRSLESKKKMSEWQKGEKSPMYGKKLSNEHKCKISKSMKGNKCHLWKGGITHAHNILRTSLKYRQWRQDCFIRDNFTCQECSKQGGNLHVHHKRLFSKLMQEARNYMPLLNVVDACMLYTPLWDIKNGITFCRKCHKTEKHKHLF